MAGLGVSELGRGDDPLHAADSAAQWSQEMRKLVFEAHQEASQLRAERQALIARSRDLERAAQQEKARSAALAGQLKALQRRPDPPPRAPAGEPWLNDMADRTVTALRSGQDAAQAIVERARQRAAGIEAAAAREATALRQQAEEEAQRVLAVAQFDAEGVLQGAQASAAELLAQARAAADRVMAELAQRRQQLEREVDALEGQRMQLLKACAAIQRPVEEAIRALQRGGPPGRAPSAGSRARAAAARISHAGRPAPEGAGPGR